MKKFRDNNNINKKKTKVIRNNRINLRINRSLRLLQQVSLERKRKNIKKRKINFDLVIYYESI